MAATLSSAVRKTFLLGTTGLTALTIYRYQKLEWEEANLPTNVLFSFSHNGTNTKLSSGAKGKDNGRKNDEKKKNVVVIGGGVVGVTAAYKLALKGHSVALLEPRENAGEECSACAAGGMQRSNPVVDRGTWIAVTKCLAPFTRHILGGSHEPYRFFHIDWLAAITDPFFLRWSTTFTKTSFFPSKEQSRLQMEMLKFTDYAVKDMVKMMENKKDPMAVKSGYNPNGSLSLSYDPVLEEKDDAPSEKKPAAANPTRGKNLEPSKVLKGKDISSEEPSILHQELQPTTCKYEYEACAASSGRFTQELAERCRSDPKLDVTFFYDTRVKGVAVGPSEGNTNRQRVTQLKTKKGIIDVTEDTEVLVAAGAWSTHVCALMNLYCPVYPLKGYAFSLSAKDILSSSPNLTPNDLPQRIVSDKYMFTSRLGDEIRFTSIGEFSGWDTAPTPQVKTEFIEESIRQFPHLEKYIRSNADNVKCGHRPYVSDGILLLGRVDSFENLMVSCGPGSNGWKLAMGSGEIVEKLVSGMTEEEISEELGFDANAFSPKGRVLRSPLFSKICRAGWNV